MPRERCSVVVRALLAPEDHARGPLVPVEDTPPREHRERRTVRAYETEAVRLDDGINDERVPVSGRD